MNWKDQIILGAIAGSGEFKIQYTTSIAGDRIAEIEGIETIRPNFFTNVGTIKISDCQLIARPVSDMSDEEINFLYQGQNNFSMKQRRAILKNRVEHDALYFTDVLYLLSIRVLPESLADEDVIWKGKGA